MDAALLLASASPRRRRLIGWLGVDTEVTSVETPEDMTAPLPPAGLAASIAAEKAEATGARPSAVVLALDTVVVHAGRVLGKPADRADARRMLDALSGGVHQVVTGVALLGPDADEPETFAVTTEVTMRRLPAETLDAWLAGDEVLGCAGAYNIERHLASVADAECYQNVAGMPLCHIYRALASRAGRPDIPGLVPPVAACNAALGRSCLLGPGVCAAAPR